MYNLYSISSSIATFELAPLSKNLQLYSKYANAHLDTYFDMKFLHILNIYTLLICYMSVFYSLYILNNSEKRRASQRIEYTTHINMPENKIEFPIIMKHYKINNILDDISISDEIKINVLDTFLNNSSLNKYYIIYFIFTKQYNFFIDNAEQEVNSNGETVHYTHIKLNSYEEYKKIKREYGGGINCHLDETVEMDLVVNLYNHKKFNTYDMIYDKKYNTCRAHINFISWIYYSGLYTYLMTNINIKTQILNDMNEKQLLYGSIFLQYKLFLADLVEDSTNEDEISNAEEDEISNADEDEISNAEEDEISNADEDEISNADEDEPLEKINLEETPLETHEDINIKDTLLTDNPLKSETLDNKLIVNHETHIEDKPLLETQEDLEDINFTNCYNNNNTTIKECLINTSSHIKQNTIDTFTNLLFISYSTIYNTITNTFIYILTNIVFYFINRKNNQQNQHNQHNQHN